ncbi:MAG TPA: YfhO family protein [Candidatus Omnitrophota bacterium]|nr:YfhO family protein [Candidatus Omnitrophota bacterium]
MREYLRFLAAFIVLSALWFFKELFLGYIFCFMDLSYYFYPYRHFMVESVRHLQFPFWNRFIYFGFPFFATLQHGLFYPLSFLYFIMPFDLGFNLFLIVHYPLAAANMFMYLSRRGCSFWGKTVGAVTFAFSGYLLSVLFMPTSLAAVAWFPLALLFFEKLMAGEKRSFLYLSLVLLMLFLGGEPTVLYITLAILAIHALTHEGGIKKTLFVAAAALVTAGLAAFQLFPFIELALNSVRVGGLSYFEATQWSVSPQRVIEFIVPFFYHMTSVPWASLLWLKSLYLGIIPILLLPAASYAPDRRTKWFLVSVLLAGLVLAMGKNTPVYYVLFNFLPGFSSIRYPAKFLFLTTFAISALAAMGWDVIFQGDQRIKRYHFGVLSAGALLVLSSVLGLMSPQIFYSIARPLYSEEIKAGFGNLTLAMNMRNIANCGISGFFLLGAGLVLWLARREKKIMLVLVPLMLWDLSLTNYGLNFSVPDKWFHITSPNLELISNDRSVFRVLASPDLVKRELKETADETVNYLPAQVSIRDRLPVNQNMNYGIECCQGYESVHGADAEKLLSRIYSLDRAASLRALNGLNIKYIVAAYPMGAPGYRLVSRRPEYIRGGEILLYRNQNVLPRGYEVASFEVIADREKLLDRMFSGKFDPARTVLLESSPGPCDRLFYLSDAFYPGWKAYVDGREAPLLRANFMFRAVPLPPGPHRVDFKYDPRSFKLGLLVSLFTACALFVYHIKNR